MPSAMVARMVARRWRSVSIASKQLAQPAGHEIEILRQRGDLLIGRDGHLHLQIAAGQARGHAAQLQQRARGAARDQHGQHQRDRRREQRRGEDGEAQARLGLRDLRERDAHPRHADVAFRSGPNGTAT